MYKILLREIRESRNISQSKLSRLTDIPQPTISCMENRTLVCDLDRLDRIAKALGVSIKDLFVEL
ncbi:helix-turn-helix domain-containing protein [Vallitalea longa]|uniref:helix-turn-helix domain-containing protein n=1 Tax=Vallitalea longa TaxID=2936439 RepID=UPI00248F663A|nr:helix-turn-helix transcriptional regulator [Vallitalea longa]